MEGRRRTIEVDEEVAVALEKRAAERGVSLEDHLSDLAQPVGGHHEIEQSDEERADLARRVTEWERDRLGVPLEEASEWMRSWGRPDELPRPRSRRL